MGRFSVMMVLGLCFVLMIMGPNMYRYATSGYQNYIDYYTRMQSHNIALSAVNIASNAFFINSSWTAGYSNISFNGGTYTVKVDSQLLPNSILYRKILTSISTYQGWHDTVTVTFQPSNFAEFCVYLNNMSGVFWATGDTVWGPCHVENTFNVSGTPVFYGKTTSKLGTSPATLPSGGTNPHFYGGYQSGVSVPMPTSFAKAETAAAQHGKVYKYPGNGSNYRDTVTLNADSTITIKEVLNGVTQAPVTSNITTLAPNCTIWFRNSNVYIQGTLKGKLTIIASDSAGAKPGGNFFIIGNILYATDPSRTGGGTDMLGLCADSSIDIHAPINLSLVSLGATPLPQHDIIVEGALFTRLGKFYCDFFSNSSAKNLGGVKVIGSLVSNTIGAFSQGSGASMTGYKNLFLFDNRFYNSFPPNYPVTGYFNIVAWRE